jgi:hypothetical protein
MSSMDKADVLAAIARVRRAMPRNTDMMGVCDALERVMVAPVVPDLSRDMGPTFLVSIEHLVGAHHQRHRDINT